MTLVSTIMISCLNCCYCLLFDHLEATLAHIHPILQTEIRVILWKYKLNHSIPYSYFLMCFHLTQSLHLQGPVYWLPDISLTSSSTTHPVIPSSRVMLTSTSSLEVPWLQLFRPLAYHALHPEHPFLRYPHGSLPHFLSLHSNGTLQREPN